MIYVAVRDILDGVLPELPDGLITKRKLFNISDELIDFVMKRINHPLFVAFARCNEKVLVVRPRGRG